MCNKATINEQMSIEISQRTFKNPHKSQNGDFCAFKVLAEEELVVLAISDGVGSSPCDWKASRISCEKFIEEFEHRQTSAMVQRLEDSIYEVNKMVLSTAGSCEGMKATFCAVVWDFKSKTIGYTNIGDSRIYEKVGGSLHQLSEDEVKSVILKKKDGKPMVVSGIVVIAEGVTNVIGSKELTFEVKTKNDEGVRAIVLTTDGFHGLHSSFEDDVLQVINTLNLEHGLDNLFQQYKDDQKDDMTILALRRKTQWTSTTEVISSVLDGRDISEFSILEVSEAILPALERGIKEKDARMVKKLLDIGDEQGVDWGKDVIGNLISQMSRSDFQDRGIYQNLLLKLRSSKW